MNKDNIKMFTPEDGEPDDFKDMPFKVFLAGTIDNGESDDWQKKVFDHTKKLCNKLDNDQEITFLNPRRPHWDPNGGREAILKQIDWEQQCLHMSDLIVINLLSTSKSPISLLELGLFAKSGKVIVFCPEKFYRYENVLDTCKRYDVEMYKTDDAETIATMIVQSR